MKRAVLVTAIILGGMYLVSSAWGQEDMTHVDQSAFKDPTRPKALFSHDAHNEKAGIDDCATCHHVYEDGVLQKDDSSEGIPCSDCHQPVISTGKEPTLMHAFHKRCNGCHRAKKSGPLMCGQCHKR